MHIKLCALTEALATAWENYCGDLNFVSIEQGSILEIDCDAVVSPANSFGFMDGGIDAVYKQYFGEAIELAVRRQIYEVHAGELVVGSADIVETQDEHIPFLIAAPTMRVPMVIRNTPNAYLAARATFLLVKHGVFTSGQFEGEAVENHVETVALPGLGTGVGKISYDVCAKQVREAINHIVLEQYTMPQSWTEAVKNHRHLGETVQ